MHQSAMPLLQSSNGIVVEHGCSELPIGSIGRRCGPARRLRRARECNVTRMRLSGPRMPRRL